MSAERLRVLHVIQNLNYGGMERLLWEMVHRYDRNNVEAHVLVIEYRGRYAAGLETVATIHEAPAMPKWSLVHPSDLARMIQGIGPHVVHSHSGVWYKAARAARMAGVPLVIHTEHGRQIPDPWIARFLDGLAARSTDVVVAVSDSVADILSQRVVKQRCGIEIVLNGVDTDRFRPLPDTGRLRAELRLDAATPILGSIGRLERIKGYDVMLDAFARLLDRPAERASPVLVIAGDGTERPRLERSIEARGLGGHVHLLGWRDDIADLISAFACFTMASRSEGTSISLLEAMSCGLCPVVTDVGGNGAILGPTLRHRLVRPQSPDALEAAWTDVLANQAAREADARLARQRVLAAFSVANMVSAYEGIYRRGLNGAALAIR